MDALCEQLAAACGCFNEGTSALGHPKRSLLKYATSGAKRQLTLLKELGVAVVVVPFHELVHSRCASEHHASCAALEYVQALLYEHVTGCDPQ